MTVYYMEDRRANLIAFTIILFLLIFLVVARLCFKLSKTFFLILGADLAAILGVLAFTVIRSRFSSRRKQLETDLDSRGRELRIEYSFLRKVAGVPAKFRHHELEEATDGFRSVIGRGASGCVFKGILSDGTAIAVKRIDGEEQGDKAFKSEVSAIASVQHVNLVRLLGYCPTQSPGGPRFLVYEFIHNGSLENWIFPDKSSQQQRRGGCLSWELRCGVALDVAKALCYLHHDCRSCILHLDVKPENILIDENYRALVSDFGLSKLKGREDSRVVTTIRGTRGYLAPEWLLENGVSEKSDVYSYGMVLLEIIGGRKNICKLEGGKKFEFFPRIVAEKFSDGKVMEVVDPRVCDGVEEKELRRMVVVALWCIQEKAKLRPSMARVVEMLVGRVPVDDPPTTQMLVVDLLRTDHQNGNAEKPHAPAAAATKPRFLPMDADNPAASANSFSFSSLTGR